jgi:HAD superfamily 5'-nucleotidase-like hydrolase
MMKVFVNRTLNLKKIQFIGFDMDHTLIRYNSENFERLAHSIVLQKLIASKNYPAEIKKLPFEFNRMIRGLVLDKKKGNLLKLNKYAGIRLSYHGTRQIEYLEQKKIYKSIYIDLGDKDYFTVDTTFSISHALLFAQLVDLKDNQYKVELPSYDQIAHDIESCLDEAHRDGSIKDVVIKDLDKYVMKNEAVVAGLERFKFHGKKLFLLTNSLYDYTKVLMDFALNPFLKKHKDWTELFDVVITGAQKPRFFWDKLRLLKVDPSTGLMTNYESALEPGLYQGGCADILTKSFKVSGEEILYIGDHIYGDIVRLKKDCNWRTALVVEDLDEEILALKKMKPIDDKIQALMREKEPFERRVLEMLTANREVGTPVDQKELDTMQDKIGDVDSRLRDLIKKHQENFNPYWGEVMRIGAEESYFASQVQRYACIYMPTLDDLFALSPRTYLRAHRTLLPHEIAIGIEL